MEIRLKYGSSYVTLPSNNITELTQEANLYASESFYIGSTVCRSFKLGVDKRSLSALPDDGVLIYEGSTKYADLVIDNIDDEDVRSYKFTLTDRMVRLNEQDVSWFTSGQTIQQLLGAICTQYGIAGVDTIAAYGDVAITWYDNWTARDFVSWVAELLGGYAYISANNYLKFDTYSNTPVQTIPVENCDSFKLGEQITIDRVVYDLPGKTVKYPVDYSGTGCTLYLNTDNALFTDSGGLSIEDQVEYIYNVINGFSFYNIKVGKCPINRDVRAGQCIGFSLDGTVYNTIAQVNWNYNSMWLGGYELKLDSPVQAETQIVGAAKKTQTIIQKIDREVGEITQTVSGVQETVFGNPDDPDSTGLQGTVTQLSQRTQSLEGFRDTVSTTYATQTALSDLNTTLSTTIEQTDRKLTTTISEVKTIVDDQGEHVTKLETYIRETSRGLEISKNTEDINMVLENDELGFYQGEGGNATKLAWLSANEGLGAPALSVGDATTARNRWRIFTRQDGSHLTFTRHN